MMDPHAWRRQFNRIKYVRRRTVLVLLLAGALLAVLIIVLTAHRQMPVPVTGGRKQGAVPAADLSDPVKKEIAMELVSSAENSSLDWKAQYGYIEWNVEGVDSENRGYTAGIVGFCSGCGDMTRLIDHYTTLAPDNRLRKYLPALHKQEVLGMGHVTQAGLGPDFVKDWKAAGNDDRFRQAQNDERDRVYFNPAVSQAKDDGLHALGQFMYYDALVVHGPGDEPNSASGIRAAAMQQALTPAQGGDETTYLNAYLNARITVMKSEQAHTDASRAIAQRKFLHEGNLNLTPPLNWKMYGDPFEIKTDPKP